MLWDAKRGENVWKIEETDLPWYHFPHGPSQPTWKYSGLSALTRQLTSLHSRQHGFTFVAFMDLDLFADDSSALFLFLFTPTASSGRAAVTGTVTASFIAAKFSSIYKMMREEKKPFHKIKKYRLFQESLKKSTLTTIVERRDQTKLRPYPHSLHFIGCRAGNCGDRRLRSLPWILRTIPRGLWCDFLSQAGYDSRFRRRRIHGLSLKTHELIEIHATNN